MTTTRERITYPATCCVCSGAMRPNGSDKTQWPGTTEHWSKGHCTKIECRNALEKQKGADVRSKSLEPATGSPAWDSARKARRRAGKPRIGRMLFGGAALWWVKLPGIGVRGCPSMQAAATLTRHYARAAEGAQHG